jgi:hypothetical protein
MKNAEDRIDNSSVTVSPRKKAPSEIPARASRKFGPNEGIHLGVCRRCLAAVEAVGLMLR